MVWLGVPEIDGRVRPHLPLGDGYRCKMQHCQFGATTSIRFGRGTTEDWTSSNLMECVEQGLAGFTIHSAIAYRLV